MRKPKKGQSLAEKYPEVAAQWHPTKNGELTPFQFSCKTHYKIYWFCEKGSDHVWLTSIANRTKGTNCPICSGNQVVKSTSIASTHKEILSLWHPIKNKDVKAYEISSGSSKKVWWKCPKGLDHEWETTVSSVCKMGTRCPMCSGRKVVDSNCLATTHPKIAAQWHPIKNGKLTPNNTYAGTHKRIWWKCDKGIDHEWDTRCYERTGKDSTKCPVCSGNKVVKSNSLATTHPHLIQEWHQTKNYRKTPEDYISGSNKKVWWKCTTNDKHVWESAIWSRTGLETGCPYCSGNFVSETNNFKFLFPKIAEEWHPSLNKDSKPEDFTSGSNKQVWWKCTKELDHIYKSSISGRTGSRKRGCPMCSGRTIVKSNSLATTHPKIAAQWHPSKNDQLTPNQIGFGSGKKVWWKCNKGEDHEWRTSVSKRSSGRNCPYCTLTPQSKQELTITFELITLFPDINPRGFKTKLMGKLWSIDIFIPLINLGIEFDGHYWHKSNRSLDKLKTKKLKSEGFNILRVREEPLEKISDSDIISKQPFNAKEVTNNILTHIMNSFELEDVLVKKIKAYISKKKLQNEKGLDEYIEMRLTEKAEKD